MRREALPPVETVPTTFQVGQHAVIVCSKNRRWFATVDTTLLDGTYESQVEAWEAGVREVARRDTALV